MPVAWSPNHIGDAGEAISGPGIPPGLIIAPLGITTLEAFGTAIVSAPQMLNVSNRARVNQQKSASTATWVSRTYHTLFCGAGRSLTSLQVAWANWYAQGTESGSGGSMTIKLWVEYPIGTTPRQQVTWGGLATGTIADGATQYCDTVTLNTPIPNGAKVGIWAELVPSVAICFSNAKGKNTVWGDAINVNQSAMTASSTITDNAGAGYQGPCSIRGLTTSKALVCIGDSRLAGTQDAATDADGLNGEIGRTFGPSYPLINMGDPGALGSQFVSSHALRLALSLADANYMFYEYGINDVVASPASVAEASAASALALFTSGGYRRARLTIVPASDSSNNWTAADGSDQTTKSYDGTRRTLNSLILANAGGWDIVYDFAGVNELAPVPSGKWKGDGTAQKYTIDGVHESTFGNQQYAIAFPTLL